MKYFILFLGLLYSIPILSAQTTEDFEGSSLNSDQCVAAKVAIESMKVNNSLNLGCCLDKSFNFVGTAAVYMSNGGGGGNTVEYGTFYLASGNPFIFTSVWVSDEAGFGSTHYNVTGYSGGSVQFGPTNITVSTANVHTFNWDNVDSIRFTAIPDGKTDVAASFDNIVYTEILGNAAPTASSFTAASGPYQNLVYTFATGDFSYADGNSDALDHLRITSIPGSGTLYVDVNDNDTYDGGEEIANSDQISKADLDNGNLQFITTNTTNTSFIFDVNDGTEYSASTYIATLNIVAEPTVTLSISAANIAEDGSSSTITATLSGAYGADVTVNLSKSGTATETDDYTLGNSITITAGNTSNNIALTSVADFLVEGDETVIIDVSTVDNATENGTQQVTCTITDDDIAPIVTTSDVSDVNNTSATCGGEVSSQGSQNVTARGVVWSSTTSPTLTTNEDGHTSDNSGLGMFVSSITGLTPNTTYYVRAYATSLVGTYYGAEKTFVPTDIVISTVLLAKISDTEYSFTTDIINPSAQNIIEKGIVWGLSENPTIQYNANYVIAGTGSTSFNANATNLGIGFGYYIRAYVTTANGTYYSNQIHFGVVPTLPEWGLILLAGGFVFAGAWFMLKRII